MYVYDLSPHKLPNFETLPILRMLNSAILLRFEFPSSLHDKFRDVNVPWFSASRVCCIRFRVLVSRLFFCCCCNLLFYVEYFKANVEGEKKLRNVGITKQSWSSLVLRRISKIAENDYELCLVRLFVRIEQFDSHWTDFHFIWYLNTFLKAVEKIQVSLKPDKNNGSFTWRPIHIFDHISLISS